MWPCHVSLAHTYSLLVTQSSRHTVNSSHRGLRVSSHSQLVISEHIQCTTKPSDVGQIVLRKCSTRTATRGHAGKGVLKTNDLKNIRVSWRRQQQWLQQQEQTDSVPSSTDGMSAVSDRPSVTSASYHCAIMSCDHWCFWATCADAVSKWLSYRPISTVNWRSYVWL